MDIKWKQGTQHKVEPEAAYKVVMDVRKKNNGEASADDIVKAATPKRNPLHPEFEWDDATAGHEYRLTQARAIVRHLVEVRKDTKTSRPQRIFEVVRVPQKVDSEGKRQRVKSVYRTVEDIMADPDMRSELLGRALRELISIRNRYRDLQELAVVLRAIDEVVGKIDM